MTLSTLSQRQIEARLKGSGLVLRTGPFNVRIHTPLPSVAEATALLYADYPLVSDDEFVDFDVRLDPGGGLRRWVRQQVRFIHEGFEPFEPLPVDHAPAFMEWAMNWCISTQAHQYLMLHAAVVERNGFAAILPAPPGSGKSTLCAGLVTRGWRLLSDELGLISLRDGRIDPLVRPISLKNASIDVIRRFAPSAVFSRSTERTSKGTVAHMKVARSHLEQANEPVRPAWVVYPKFEVGTKATLTQRPRADSLLELGRNSFNYSLLGEVGFKCLADVVAACTCHDFRYGDLDEAVAVFDTLASTAKPT